MSGSLPQSLEGAQAPNALELLWERNRRLVQALFWLLALGLMAYYGVKYYGQKQLDAKWSKFAAASFLHETYSPDKVDLPIQTIGYEAISTILDDLRDTSAEKFDKALATAEPEQVPYLLWLQANHAGRNGDIDKAVAIIDRLSSTYPNHPLVVSTGYPVQVRDEVEKDPSAKEDPKDKDKEPELKPAVTGSIASVLIDRLKAAKDYVAPAQFKMPTIPADAPRYRFTLDGDAGSFVVALMTHEAPKHCAKFEEIVAEKFWEGIKVDEIARPGKSRWSEKIWQIHFGFEATKTEANRADWDTSVASKDNHVVEEITHLSHFPGAISARQRDGKSEVDRLYVSASDCASQDDSRQVFAYIVEGMETVKRVSESSFDRSEDEERGRGRPAENIVIKSVEKL